MEEYIVYKFYESKIFNKPLNNVEWKVVKLYLMRALCPVEVLLCKFEEKTLIRPLEFSCKKENCTGPKYGYHCDYEYKRLFRFHDAHCKDLPKDRVMDISSIIAPGKIVGYVKLLIDPKDTELVPREKSKDISNWEKYLVEGSKDVWLLLYSCQDGREYLKVFPNVVNQIGYPNIDPHWNNKTDTYSEIVVDVTGLIEYY
jgi:hypothetical protein